MKVFISSGHGLHIRGASGSPIPPCMDEVDEARKFTDEIARQLQARGVTVKVFHDNTSYDQGTNLTTIVNAHNAWGDHDYDLSVHLNCYNGVAHGCEVLYVSSAGEALATDIVDAICTASGLTNRGAKHRSDLKFLNSTREVSALLEMAFCDNPSDCDILRSRFTDICSAIAAAIVGDDVQPGPGPDPGPEPPSGVLFAVKGKVSYFGGPNDQGVSPSEQLAFITDEMQAPQLFLPYQPDATTGLARRLNPWTPYCAARWDYEVTSKSMLRDSGQLARVTNPRTGNFIDCWPADWGPHSDTNRVMDLSPLVMTVLDLTTDSEAELTYPAPD